MIFGAIKSVKFYEIVYVQLALINTKNPALRPRGIQK